MQVEFSIDLPKILDAWMTLSLQHYSMLLLWVENSVKSLSNIKIHILIIIFTDSDQRSRNLGARWISKCLAFVANDFLVRHFLQI